MAGVREELAAGVIGQAFVDSPVTPADLQAPVVTVIALSYLVAIEAGLAHLVVSPLGTQWMDAFPDEEAGGPRPLSAQGAAERCDRHEQCLYFTDWLTLTLRSVELRKALGSTSIVCGHRRVRMRVGKSISPLVVPELACGANPEDGGPPLDPRYNSDGVPKREMPSGP